MSFFQAEIKGKVGLVEDSLTAKAFGVLNVRGSNLRLTFLDWKRLGVSP